VQANNYEMTNVQVMDKSKYRMDGEDVPAAAGRDLDADGSAVPEQVGGDEHLKQKVVL
jgi:hypothetical protein